MPSEYTESEKRGAIHGTDVAFDTARVVGVPGHVSGDTNQHQVEVQTNPKDPNSSVMATVHTSSVGDVNIPNEGDIVRVGYEKGEQPIVLGTRYTVKDGVADPRLPEYGPGHRRISGGNSDIEPPDDGHLELYPDGTVELQPAPGKPLILGGGTQQVFLYEDFTYQPNSDYFMIPFDRVETRLLSQQFLDEHSIQDEQDTAQLPLWDDATFEWVIPKEPESKWREPDPRGALWTVQSDIRFEMIMPQTACEVGLFIREKDQPFSDLQLVESSIGHGSHQNPIPALNVDLSCTERFPYESRLSIHVRSVPGGGVISSNALTFDRSPFPINSVKAGGLVENWDERLPRVRQTNVSLTRSG